MNESACSAELHSAVSPICNRENIPANGASDSSSPPAAGESAIPPGATRRNGSPLSRREFLGVAAAAGATVAFGGIKAAAAETVGSTSPASTGIPIYFFSKPLDAFEPEFMADTLAAAGLAGFDLTVRPGGKVLPERAETDLPKFAEAVRSRNLTVRMMVTAISSVRSPHAETVLKAASAVGVQHYRLGYFDFDFQAGIAESLRKHRATLLELAALNARYRIQAGYQNHAGTRVGAAVWDLAELLRDVPVEQASVQYDIRHAIAEGSASWVVGMRLLRGHIGSLAIKDFTWDLSARRPRIVNVPLGEGIVDFDAFFRLVKELGLRVPISLHIEYPLLTRAEESLSLLEKQKIVTAKIKRDVDHLRVQMANHQPANP